MPGAYRITVYNKDGSEELLASTWGDFGIVVQSDRLLWNGADDASYAYVLFSNTNVIGYATTQNATVAEYPIGIEYTPSFGSTLTLYEVERDPYNITLSKNQIIVKCKDKTMEKDLVIKSEQPEPLLEEKTVDLSMASGNQEITPTSGSYLKKVTITKPSTLIAGNIKKDITIGGVTGIYENSLPNGVSINGTEISIDTDQFTAVIAGQDGDDETGKVVITGIDIPVELKPNTDSSVKVTNLTPANIKKDVSILGVTGTLESGPSISYWNGMYTDGDN